jgi:hypothetical protein
VVPAAGTRTGLVRLLARLAPRREFTHAQERAAMAAGLAQARARLEARWAIRLDRWPGRRRLMVWCRRLVCSRR